VDESRVAEDRRVTTIFDTSPSIGYVPHGAALERPFDRRRFPRYAAMRGLDFDLVSGWQDHEIVVLSPSADVTQWVSTPSERRIVVDLPDAYLDERRGLRRSFRGLAKWLVGESHRPVLSYSRAMERLLARADAVACSTEEQAVSISNYTDNVHAILDLHGELEFLAPAVRETTELDIVWEGLIATLPAMREVLPALRSLARGRKLRLHLVTDLQAPRYMNRFFTRQTEDLVADWGIDVRLHQWSIDTLTEISRACDIAIVPVDLTDPMAVGKPENRMRIFWRLGLPVVASASPSHVRAASLAGLGDRVLCSTADDWRRTLESLHVRPEDRLAIATAGQETALTAYSEESLAQRWDRLFESL